ncbi:Alpha/Beta hydrolase protein [Hyaloscypha sp. PMI_1271]|nr:Alpha/Beta hydrolase protein [Hyaloscypha sp. PMI_1271]
MATASWIKSHPGKGFWTLTAILFNVLRLPLWLVYFLPSFTRQSSKWSLRQALGVRILQAVLKNMSDVEMKTPGSLKPGKEGDRFVKMQPAKNSKYIGIASKDKEINPVTIGGTWYPKRPSPGTVTDVILHFHGGAYVIGDGRQDDCGFAAKTLLQHTSATHVFCPQYRLASNPGGRFPAQLQDAVTSLLHLTDEMQVPARKITISGDSAGGNLCLALLRYIADNPKAAVPSPGCAFLWSPWVDPAGSLEVGHLNKSPNAPTDYLVGEFGTWGARALSPSPSTGIKFSDPNICFIGTAFATPTPLFFHTGECEALYHDDAKAYEEFTSVKGNTTELQIAVQAVHDIILVGKIVGFEKEAAFAARQAGDFLKQCRGLQA